MSLPSVDLPVELIEAILSISPVKTLLRFKSVSKQWEAIISEPRFSRIHRIQRSKLSENQNTYVVWKRKRKRGLCISLMRLEEDGKLTRVSELDHQPLITKDHRDYSTPLCSCNGMFLLTNDHRDYMLWNPSIRKSTVISAACSYRYPSNHHMYHDETSDDYKIVIVYTTVGVHKRDHHHYTVYSCKNRSWGGMLDFPCDVGLIGLGHSAFVDGCFYVLRNDEEVVIFDVRDGKLDRFPQPNYDHDHAEEEEEEEEEEEGAGSVIEIVHNLHAISGRLCFSMCTYKTLFGMLHRRPTRFRLWVMERNEKLEQYCWRKLMSTDMDMDDENTWVFLRSMCLSNEDNVVIERFEIELKLSRYNGVQRGFQKIEFDYWNDPEPETFQYQENLYMPAT